jgi:hypothetical protein
LEIKGSKPLLSHLQNYLNAHKIFLDFILTIVNNDGVTKEGSNPPAIDSTKTQTINVFYNGKKTVKWVKDLRTGSYLPTQNNQTITIGPGDLAVLEFGI